MAENERYQTKPTTQLDLERRQAVERGDLDEVAGEPRSFAVEGNDLDGYIGVDPAYQNYADETHKPFAATEGVEADTEKRVSEFEKAEKANVSSDSEQTKRAPQAPAERPRRQTEERQTAKE